MIQEGGARFLRGLLHPIAAALSLWQDAGGLLALLISGGAPERSNGDSRPAVNRRGTIAPKERRRVDRRLDARMCARSCVRIERRNT